MFSFNNFNVWLYTYVVSQSTQCSWYVNFAINESLAQGFETTIHVARNGAAAFGRRLTSGILHELRGHQSGILL